MVRLSLQSLEQFSSINYLGMFSVLKNNASGESFLLSSQFNNVVR